MFTGRFIHYLYVHDTGSEQRCIEVYVDDARRVCGVLAALSKKYISASVCRSHIHTIHIYAMHMSSSRHLSLLTLDKTGKCSGNGD